MSTPIVRYRKRSVVVETIQWTGDNVDDVQDFTGHMCFVAVDPEDRGEDPDITALVWDRLHSTWVGVKTGQHIVRGVKRELYPIAEDVLAETYEPADAPLHTACRAEALREAERLARRVVAGLWGDGSTVQQLDLAAGARAVEWEIGRLASGQPSRETDATPSFFQVGHTYTDNNGYRAPELTWYFRCAAPTETPAGERIAFGFARRGDRDEWTATGFGSRDWESGKWTDVTEMGEGRA